MAINYPNTGGYVAPSTSTYNAYSAPVTTPIIWVENEANARNAYVAPGTTGFFMERQNPRFYVKSTALSGEIASFKIFEFTEVAPEPQVTQATTAQYVTIEDFNKSMEELKQLISQKGQHPRYNKEKDNA